MKSCIGVITAVALFGLAGCEVMPSDDSAPAEGLSITTADAAHGLEGQLRQGKAVVTFESRQSGESLTATIRGGDGAVLAEYREFGHERTSIQTEAGQSIPLRRTPELRVIGMPYTAFTAEQAASLRAFASTPEGALLRQLALQLVDAVPETALVEERRGLELPLQALWEYYDAAGAPTVAVTPDYEIGPTGYLVLTQPGDLVLKHNYVASAVSALHSDSQVNNCFGRCGSGCTGGVAGVDFWPSQPSTWVDTYGTTFAAQQQLRCETGRDVMYTWYATPTTHTVSGWWTPGCQLHDNCCAAGSVACYSVCMPLVPAVPILSTDGETRTWTYTDYGWDIRTQDYGYSGCTCPGVDPWALQYECTVSG